MLTADLLDYRRRQGRVHPRLLDPAAPAVRAAAEAVLQLVQAHVGRPRGELEEALRGLEPVGLPPRAGPGLARLLLERCTFEVAAVADPPALRQAVFAASAEAWRADPAAGTEAWRAAVLARAAQALGLERTSPAHLEAALFADLEEHQRLLAMEPLRAEELPYRYNVAQVQGLLLRAERVTLAAPWPEPRRLRQLLRYLKFFRLLFRQEPPPAARGGARALRLVVDGPLSVLESATRYGLELAQFFPALLLWAPPWRLEADVRPGTARGGRALAQLVVEPHPWLRSHYPDHGQWVPEEVRRFVDAFNAVETPWRAAPAEALLPLPDNRSLVPDFEFRRAGAPPLYLEHLPYPDATGVQARLAQVAAAGRRDYLLACRAVPAVKALGERPGLLAFRRSLLPNAVRTALERLEAGD